MKKHLKIALSVREEPFFRTLSDPLLGRIDGLVYHHRYEPRQIIHFPDEACDYAYWVREGRVKVSRKTAAGREMTFRHLFPGDLFGEECLVETGKRGVYAEAMMDTVLCLMRAGDFRRLAREEGEFSLQLAKWLCQRAAEQDRVFAETVFKSVRSRVASGLLRLYRRAPKSDRGALYVTHQEIASLVGSTRETTTGVLHRLEREGILSIANRKVTVVDMAALERAARSE